MIFNVFRKLSNFPFYFANMNHYLLLLGLVGPSLAVYAGTDVVELTPANFQKEVIKSDSVWIVEFYAPWCGHCQRLVPDYTKAAKALKGVVKVA